jgi:hypothetical protein
VHPVALGLEVGLEVTFGKGQRVERVGLGPGDDQRGGAAGGVLVLPHVEAQPVLLTRSAPVDQRQVTVEPGCVLAADPVGEPGELVEVVPGGKALEQPGPFGVRPGLAEQLSEPGPVLGAQRAEVLAGHLKLGRGQDAVVVGVADAGD